MWKPTQEKLEAGLDWAYRQAIHGELPFVESAEQLANDYKNEARSLEDAVKLLVRWRTAKASTAGFLTGLGGVITIPITLPPNLAITLFIQLRIDRRHRPHVRLRPKDWSGEGAALHVPGGEWNAEDCG